METQNGGENISIDFEKVSQELKIRSEIYKKLVLSFSDTLGDRMKSLEEALDQMDTDKMRAILHEIKGTAGNLRLVTISMAEGVMHVAVKEDAAKEQLQEYYTTLKTRVEDLQQYIAKQES